MSTITLALGSSTLAAAEGRPLTVTASVTNTASVPARIVLAPFAPVPGADGAVPASAQGWTVVERPVREIAAQATEQFTVTVTPPAGAPAGDHLVRLIAYDNDRPPEEYRDQAQQLKVTVPAGRAVAASHTPWWIYVAAAVLVLVVGVVAFFVLQPTVPTPLPTPSPTPTVTTTLKPTFKPTLKPTFKPTIKITKVPTVVITKVKQPVVDPTDG